MVEGCRICGSQRLDTVLDLGMQPWCNDFLQLEDLGKEPKYPLRLCYCLDCSLSQLDYTVKKEVMFGDHTYLSGITRSLSDHFKNVASDVHHRFFVDSINPSILDIGSNDGTQLKHYHDLGWNVLGVESSKITSQIANKNGIETINTFYNYDVSVRLNKKFDVINASGVFFHLEELHSVTKGIKHSLSDRGIFVVQFLYMKKIMQNIAFDQIYHEHLLYYNLKTLQKLLEMYELELFDAYLSDAHGGQMIGFVGHRGSRDITERLTLLIEEEIQSGCNEIGAYHQFAKNVEFIGQRSLDFLMKCKADGKLVYGMGAPVKGNTLLNYFDIGIDYLPFLVEKNKLRDGLFSPGMHIPIVMEDELERHPDAYFVLAWNFKKEILQNNQYLIDLGVEFFFPIEVS